VGSVSRRRLADAAGLPQCDILATVLARYVLDADFVVTYGSVPRSTSRTIFARLREVVQISERPPKHQPSRRYLARFLEHLFSHPPYLSARMLRQRLRERLFRSSGRLPESRWSRSPVTRSSASISFRNFEQVYSPPAVCNVSVTASM